MSPIVDASVSPMLTLVRHRCHRCIHRLSVLYSPRLVGVEENPGPKGQSNMQGKKKKGKGAVTAKGLKPAARNQGTNLSRLGAAVGGLWGPLGSMVGSTAGSFLSKISGMGDYKVRGNSLTTPGSIPTFMSSSDGVRICHREYLNDVNGSVAFSNLNLTINPGLANTFPWLSQVAYNFEEYSFKGLVFEYIPTSGTAIGTSASPALGRVIFATSYDVKDPNFVDKQQMESYEFSSAAVPFERMLHPVECAPRANVLDRLYVRSGNVPTGADTRFYDLGNFQYAVQGMPSVYTVGELWVSYDVFLSRPRLASTQTGYAHLRESPSASATAAAPMGTSGPILSSGSNLGLGIIGLSTTGFILSEPGTYLLSLMWLGTAIAAVPVITIGTNISVLVSLSDNAQSALSVFNTAGTSAIYQTVLTVVTAGLISGTNGIGVTGLTSMTGAAADVLISAVAPFSTTTV